MKYNYEELRTAAMHFDSSKADRLALWHWFEDYGHSSWNGECYDLDDGYGLFPIYEEQDGQFEVVDAEVRFA